MGEEIAKGDEPHLAIHLEVDEVVCRPGRVLSVHGLTCRVCDETDGTVYTCAVRRLLKTLSTDQRHVVAAGDRVQFREHGERRSFGRTHRANRTSSGESVPGHSRPAADPGDQRGSGAHHFQCGRTASEAESHRSYADRRRRRRRCGPIICINKVDLVDRAELQPLVGVYSRMGYRVLLVSAETGFGIDRFRRCMAGPRERCGRAERCGQVVAAERRGCGTRPAGCGGQSRDAKGAPHDDHSSTSPTELRWLRRRHAGHPAVPACGTSFRKKWLAYYRDVRPYINLCRYPDCTHTHEEDCAVKNAVADGRIDDRRYESYCHLFAGDMV